MLCKKDEVPSSNFLNGVSQGKKTLTQRGAKNQYAYTVAYAAGTIVANGYDSSGKLVAQDVQYTASDPAKLSLSSDKTSVNIGTDDLVSTSDISAFGKKAT